MPAATRRSGKNEPDRSTDMRTKSEELSENFLNTNNVPFMGGGRMPSTVHHHAQYRVS